MNKKHNRVQIQRNESWIFAMSGTNDFENANVAQYNWLSANVKSWFYDDLEPVTLEYFKLIQELASVGE